MKLTPTLTAVVPPVSASAATRFIPDTEKDKETPQVFLIRPDTYRVRSLIDELITPLLMKLPAESILNDTAIVAAQKVGLSADQQAHALDVLGSYGAFLADPTRLKDDKDAAEALAKQAREIWADLTPYWDDLAVLTARRVGLIAKIRFQTVRGYLMGWENLDAPFESGADGMVSEDALVKLGARVTEIADFIQKRATPDDNVRKN